MVARERVSVSVGSRSVGSRFGRVPSRHSDGTPRHTYVDRYESVRGCLSPTPRFPRSGSGGGLTRMSSVAGPPVPGESAAPGRPPIPVTGPRVRADPPSRPSPSFHAYTYARAYVTIHMLPHTHRICSHIFPPSLILPQSDHAIWQSVSRVSDTARRQSPITQSRMIPPVRRFRHPGHQSCLTPSGSQSCHRSVGRSSHHTGRAATYAGHHSCLTPSGSQSCHRSIGRSGHHAGRAALNQVISHVSCRQAVSHVTGGRSAGVLAPAGRPLIQILIHVS